MPKVGMLDHEDGDNGSDREVAHGVDKPTTKLSSL